MQYLQFPKIINDIPVNKIFLVKTYIDPKY